MAEASSNNASSNNANEPVTGIPYFKSYGKLFAAYWFGARRFDRFSHQDGFNPEDVHAYRALEKEQKDELLGRNFKKSKPVPVKADAAAGGAAAAAAEPAQGAETQGAKAADEVKAKIETSTQDRPWFVIIQCSFICLLYLIFILKKAGDGEINGIDPWLAGLDSMTRGGTDLRWTGPSCEDFRGEIYRWVTYQWTHIGIFHVLTNAAMLILVGVPLEGHEGSLRLCVLFNAGVIAGALCFFIFEAHGYVVGCAAGIYALIGVHIVDLIMNWEQRCFRKLTVLILCVLLTIDAITWAVTEGMVESDYSYSACVGGIVAGVILGSLIGENYFWTKNEKILAAVLSVIGGVLMIFSFAWLGANKAPLNIWESAAGQEGWCWTRQFQDWDISPYWQCVRCGTQDCIDLWSQQPKLLTVDLSQCESQGWYYDGR